MERTGVAKDEEAYKSPSHPQGRPGLGRDPVIGAGGNGVYSFPLLQEQLGRGLVMGRDLVEGAPGLGRGGGRLLKGLVLQPRQGGSP